MVWRYAAAILIGAWMLDLAVIAGTGLRARAAGPGVVVVLGNRALPDGTPSRGLRARLDAALALYREGQARQIIVSGGIEDYGMSEPAVMARYLEERGVLPAAITVDETGRNTHATAQAMTRLAARDAPVIVVSQWFHLARAEMALRQCGFRHVSAAAPRYVSPWDVYAVARETLGLPYYRLFRNACG